MRKKSRSGADGAREPASKTRSIANSIAFLVAVLTLSLLATSGTYALWNGAAHIDGSTVSTGSIGVTVNGVTSYSLVGFNAALLAPGHSVVTPITIADTGTTPIAVTLSSVGIVTNTNGLAASLTLTATPVATTGACVGGLTGGVSAPLGAFTTSGSPSLMGAGTSKALCLELGLSPTAPAIAQGGSTTFTINVTALQRRP
ncbi:hypothetical protein [Lacisediminihabitans profunda]|uniref:SipW-cognate class signal peptide n=1 Tax=Lacisediminihabitans profunda TaxID=2594790 RepID=A0A5C8UPD2_9MICO|nr:hypothetical protein [Lacisediminihabitans profunda]TXN29741.1 hypothetical protein FVP33_11355 [Lacisediminihabitans profunda]